jgi:cation diffusion facilitator family transporter
MFTKYHLRPTIQIMEKKKENVALSSVLAGVLLTTLKLIVGIITGSMGIISEAAHSALDLGAALITYFAVRASGKPADEHHHYGHGKIENLSALAETILLFITCFWIIYEAVRRLITGTTEIEIAWYSFAVMIISIIVDFSRSKALSRVAKQTNSQALEADALHFSSDIYSSSVVILGLAFAYSGVNKADSIAAIGVAILVLFVSYGLGKRTVSVLLDTAPEGLTEHIKETVLKISGVVAIERIRIRPTGNAYFVDMIIDVSRKVPLETMDKITKEVEQRVRKIIKGADVVIKVKPTALKDETITEQIQIIAANFGVSVHDISIHTLNGKKIVSFDMEVSNNLVLKKAHQKAAELKDLINKELGQDLEIDIHIEPLEPTELEGKEVDAKTLILIEKALTKVKQQQPSIYNINHVSSRIVGYKIFTAVDCLVDEKMPLEKTHDISSSVEYIIRSEIPKVERVIVHMEPVKNR